MKNKNVSELLDSKRTLLAMNLQHFAAAAATDGDDTDDPDDGGGDDDPDDGDEKDKDGGKKFTQDEVNAMTSREKKQGRKAALKDLGFASEKEAKEEIAKYNEWKKSQMSPEEKVQADLDDANKGKSEAEQRAEAAESKLAAIKAGVNPDSVDDAIAIAMLKVSDDKSLDDVLKEMKTQQRYKGFFEDSDGGKGTGSDTKHKGSPADKATGIGKRLAEKNNIDTKKSSFFRN